MKMAKMTVTPAIASEWLEKNTKNRRLSPTRVDQLAEDMKGGGWRLNGESIKLNGAVLVDGQHRLAACVAAGVPFETFVATDVPSDSFRTIDTGRSRSAADIIGIAGHVATITLAAAARLCMHYERDREGGWDTRYVTHGVLEWIDSNPSIVDSVRIGNNYYGSCRLFPNSIWSALHYILGGVDPDWRTDFLDSIASGAGLTSGSPRHALRRNLEIVSDQMGARRPRWYMAVTIKAWNADREGKKVGARFGFQSAGAHAETFPTAI